MFGTQRKMSVSRALQTQSVSLDNERHSMWNILIKTARVRAADTYCWQNWTRITMCKIALLFVRQRKPQLRAKYVKKWVSVLLKIPHCYINTGSIHIQIHARTHTRTRIFPPQRERAAVSQHSQVGLPRKNVSISVPRKTLIKFDKDDLHRLKYVINGTACYRMFENLFHRLQYQFPFTTLWSANNFTSKEMARIFLTLLVLN